MVAHRARLSRWPRNRKPHPCRSCANASIPVPPTASNSSSACELKTKDPAVTRTRKPLSVPQWVQTKKRSSGAGQNFFSQKSKSPRSPSRRFLAEASAARGKTDAPRCRPLHVPCAPAGLSRPSQNFIPRSIRGGSTCVKEKPAHATRALRVPVLRGDGPATASTEADKTATSPSGRHACMQKCRRR